MEIQLAKTPEQREETKYIRDLRKQLIRSRKENAQLRKQNRQLEELLNLSADEEIDAEDITYKKQKEQHVTRGLQCPHCSSTTIVELELRGFKYFNCSDCGSKGKLVS